ncbi:hypothetical protein SXCC_04585 [Gluconacetobacter sp. SXCC-1]|nr:hypothetical protein SXCC_04585 [Gluconacetobacter sp. SXCC-1]
MIHPMISFYKSPCLVIFYYSSNEYNNILPYYCNIYFKIFHDNIKYHCII